MWDKLNHEALLFLKDTYFVKYCVIIYSIYFQERSNIKSIPKTQGPLNPVQKQRKQLKTTILRDIESTTWNIPELLYDQ